jgi:hypothetical protein
LLADIRDRRIDIVVVYKVDRLTRSLADFAKLVELFAFVSVTQQFNGRLPDRSAAVQPSAIGRLRLVDAEQRRTGRYRSRRPR